MKNKKVAILTQPLGHNYGGIVQNFALQQVLKRLGYDPETIHIRLKANYILAAQKKSKYPHFYYFLLNETKHRFEGKRIILPTKYYFRYIHKHTFAFIKSNLKISKIFTDTDQLKLYFNTKKYGNVVVGSDQVWRPSYSPNIYNYYLDFILDQPNINKISYAASFGTNEWEYTEEQTQNCKKLVKEFHKVSVRESGGQQLCLDKLEIQSEIVLDPTLLLTAKDYKKFFNSKSKEKGLYYYILDEALEKEKILKEAEKILNLKSFSYQIKKHYSKVKDADPSEYQIPKVENWLKGFHDASFVVTDSFHGMVFSIIFKKPFIVLINKDRGADRFLSLLKMLNLEERILNGNLEELIKKPINYNEVHTKLEELKKTSMNFLIDNLK